MIPTDINTLIRLGDTFLAQEQHHKAEEKYRAALELNKDSKLMALLKEKINQAIKK